MTAFKKKAGVVKGDNVFFENYIQVTDETVGTLASALVAGEWIDISDGDVDSIAVTGVATSSGGTSSHIGIALQVATADDKSDAFTLRDSAGAAVSISTDIETSVSGAAYINTLEEGIRRFPYKFVRALLYGNNADNELDAKVHMTISRSGSKRIQI